MGDEATGTDPGASPRSRESTAPASRPGSPRTSPGAELPLSFERISGGRSNLTYGVTDAAGRRWALRRPPLGKRLGSAHDMGARAQGRLGPRRRPRSRSPPIAGLCEDESVNGAPFYVMEFVEGPILRSGADAEAFPEEAERRAIGERVVDTLVAIHAVDPDAVGLGDLGRKEDYVARQLTAGRASGRSRRRASCEVID